MLASFHGERIAAYRAVTHEVALEHAARWPRGRPVQTLGLMQELTLDVILRAVFGTTDERLAADIRATLAVGRSLPRAAAMALAQRDLGPRSRGAPSCAAWRWSTSSSWRSSPAGAPRTPAVTTCSASCSLPGSTTPSCATTS